MAQFFKQMPRHYKPLQMVLLGCNNLRKERLRVRIQHLVKTDPAFAQKKAVQIKLSGDGTKTGKRLHVMNFTLTVLDEVT